MEKRLYPGVALPLEEIALRKVTINIWYESILDPSQKRKHDWNVIEDMVKGKISKLVLPESFKKRLMYLAKPIGTDILYWKLFHEYNLFKFDLRILLHLRRTWSCAIDYRKTAEDFVHLERFTAWHRFLFASFYCLEDQIPLLWEELSEANKTYACERYKDQFLFLNEMRVLSYWCSVMRKDELNLKHILEKRQISPSTFYKQALSISARNGNKAATEYFFQKLVNEEGDFLLRTVEVVIKERSRRPFTGRPDFADQHLSVVLCYLLSLMTPEQQMQVFKMYHLEVLTYFLDWPLEYLFVDIADLYWSFLPESNYGLLLSSIHKSIKRSGYYFPHVFQELFLRSPSNFRKIFVNEECHSGSFLLEFFLIQDTETVRVIFRNVDVGDRMRLVFSEPVFKLLNDALLRGRWDIVETCIREAALSSEDRARLKGDFLEYVTRTDNGLRVKWRTHKRRRFFEFLDEMDGSAADKEETPAKVKKSCNDE